MHYAGLSQASGTAFVTCCMHKHAVIIYSQLVSEYHDNTRYVKFLSPYLSIVFLFLNGLGYNYHSVIMKTFAIILCDLYTHALHAYSHPFTHPHTHTHTHTHTAGEPVGVLTVTS